MPTASSLAWKTSLEKSGRCGIATDGAWRFTYDWSWWYPSGNRPLQQYLGAAAAGAGYGQFDKADSLIAKFKEAGETIEEIDVWAESPRLSPLWLSTSSSYHHGLLIITVITPLPTKPSATKMPENWSAGWTQTFTDVPDAWLADDAAWVKYPKELADAKAENDALRDDVAAGRRRFTPKQSRQSVREATASGVVIQPPRLADTAERDYFTSERLITMQKQLEEPRSILMSSADRVAHIDGQLLLMCKQYTRFQRSINA